MGRRNFNFHLEPATVRYLSAKFARSYQRDMRGRVLFTSRLSITLGAGRGYSLVSFGGGEYGLYVSRLTNDFGTPLAARGPLDALKELLS